MEILGYFLNLSIFLKILLISIGTYITIKIISIILKHMSELFKLDLTVISILNDIIRYIIIIISFAWILELIGIDFQNIVLSLGIMGIILGLASKDIVSNFMSGFFLIADQSIKVGEVIEVKGIKGTVKKFGFRNTQLINQENQKITIPNSLLSTAAYKNFSSDEDHRINLICILPYSINLKEFEKDFKTKINKENWVNEKIDAKIFAKSMSETGPEIKISVWIKNYSELDEKKLAILNQVNEIINKSQ